MKNKKQQSESTNSGTSAVTLDKLHEKERLNNLADEELSSFTGGGANSDWTSSPPIKY